MYGFQQKVKNVDLPPTTQNDKTKLRMTMIAKGKEGLFSRHCSAHLDNGKMRYSQGYPLYKMLTADESMKRIVAGQELIVIDRHNETVGVDIRVEYLKMQIDEKMQKELKRIRQLNDK